MEKFAFGVKNAEHKKLFLFDKEYKRKFIFVMWTVVP